MSDLFGQSPAPSPAPPRKEKRPKKEPPVYRPLTALDRARIRALEDVTFFPGTAAKRFAREINQQITSLNAITNKQSLYVAQLAWRFRRQMPRNLVPEKKPEGA